MVDPALWHLYSVEVHLHTYAEQYIIQLISGTLFSILPAMH